MPVDTLTLVSSDSGFRLVHHWHVLYYYCPILLLQ